MIRVQSIDNSSFRSIAAPRKRCDNDYDAKFLWESRNILQESTYFTIPRISHESVVYVRFLHVRSFTVRLKHKKKKKNKNLPSNRNPSAIYSDESISSFANPAPVKSQDPRATEHGPLLYNIGGRRNGKKIGESRFVAGLRCPDPAKGQSERGEEKKKGGHPDRLNSVVSAAIKLFLKYSHITGRWYANIPVPGLCRPLPRSDYSLWHRPTLSLSLSLSLSS